MFLVFINILVFHFIIFKVKGSTHNLVDKKISLRGILH